MYHFQCQMDVPKLLCLLVCVCFFCVFFLFVFIVIWSCVQKFSSSLSRSQMLIIKYTPMCIIWHNNFGPGALSFEPLHYCWAHGFIFIHTHWNSAVYNTDQCVSCLALSATDSQFCHVCGGWGGWIIIIKVPSMVGNTTDTNSHDPLKLYCDPQGFQHPSVHSKTYPINLWVALALVTNRLFAMMMMMSWCLMSSDVSWHIRDKLWPMPKHGSIILYVHGNQKAH